jgi:hypothetical protein
MELSIWVALGWGSGAEMARKVWHGPRRAVGVQIIRRGEASLIAGQHGAIDALLRRFAGFGSRPGFDIHEEGIADRTT